MTTTVEQLEAQMLELQKQIEEFKKPKPYKRWRAEKGRIYYAIISDWNITDFIELNYKTDDYKYNIWNYYKTKKEAENVIDLQLAIVRVNDRIKELNEWWEHNNEWDRYYIYYRVNNYDVDYISTYWYIRPYILNLCKTREIAKQIINEMKDDLDIIFNLK